VLQTLPLDHLPAWAETLWFLFAFAFVDALGIPLASTILMAYLGTLHPPIAVAVVGAAGTAGGSVAQYVIVRWLLRWEHRLPRVLRRARARLQQFVEGARTATFWTLFVIYATPLAAGPLRLIAAATGYTLSLFALAIGLGCVPYYFALAWVGHAIRLTAWQVVVLAAVIAVVSVIAWMRRRKRQA
jgi:uncharacterized membrane protein YdjX (TVP38/TMEM64 family)